MALSKTNKISIVIPCYNEELYIDACLESVSKQLNNGDEILVVDNNSTDKTADIARKYKGVRLISEPKQGIVFARNAGFKAAKNKIIARIDADTRVTKGWLEQVRDYYSAGGTKAVSGPAKFYEQIFGQAYGKIQEVGYFKYPNFVLGHYQLWGANMACLASSLQDIDLSADSKHQHEDIVLSRILAKTCGIEFLPEMKVLVSGRTHSMSPSEGYEYLAKWPQSIPDTTGKQKALLWPAIAIAYVLGLPFFIHYLLTRKKDI